MDAWRAAMTDDKLPGQSVHAPNCLKSQAYGTGCSCGVEGAGQSAGTPQCAHRNQQGHEWETWCMDCGKRWPNLNQADYTTTGAISAPSSEARWKCNGCDRNVLKSEIDAGKEVCLCGGDFVEVAAPERLGAEQLDEQPFYELMQAYRHAPITDQKAVIEAFFNVQQWIREFRDASEAGLRERQSESELAALAHNRLVENRGLREALESEIAEARADVARIAIERDGLREQVEDESETRWQTAIYEVCKNAVGPANFHLIDGGGCDSGDALDFTLAEIKQAVGFWRDEAEGLRDENERLKKELGR